MITAEQLDILETARRQLGFADAHWRRFMAEHGEGAESAHDLAPRGYERLVDWLVAMGLDDARVSTISADYLQLFRAFGRTRGAATDEQWRLLVAGSGHHGPYEIIRGAEFFRLLRIVSGLGFEERWLERSLISSRQVALIQRARRELGISDGAYHLMLRDVGGGVVSSRYLDQRGFERVLAWFCLKGFTLPKRGSAGKRTYGHRPGMASPAQLTLIRDLWQEATGSTDEGELGTWLERTCKVSNPRFLTS